MEGRNDGKLDRRTKGRTGGRLERKEGMKEGRTTRKEGRNEGMNTLRRILRFAIQGPGSRVQGSGSGV